MKSAEVKYNPETIDDFTSSTLLHLPEYLFSCSVSTDRKFQVIQGFYSSEFMSSNVKLCRGREVLAGLSDDLELSTISTLPCATHKVSSVIVIL